MLLRLRTIVIKVLQAVGFRFAVCLALLLFTAPVHAGQQYNTTVSATDANTAVSFGFSATSIVIINDGPDEVYISFASTTASTSGTSASFPLLSGESISPPAEYSDLIPGRDGIGLICATGETASVRVLALR